MIDQLFCRLSLNLGLLDHLIRFRLCVFGQNYPRFHQCQSLQVDFCDLVTCPHFEEHFLAFWHMMFTPIWYLLSPSPGLSHFSKHPWVLWWGWGLLLCTQTDPWGGLPSPCRTQPPLLGFVQPPCPSHSA